jgi:acetyl-CoA C-acetyltransferase
MSNAPYYVRGTRTGAVKFGHITMEDGMIADGLTCPFEGWHMGCAAEYTAKKYGVSREDQDAFAVESHRRAAEAQKAGIFKKTIAPIQIKGRKETVVFSEDESIRVGVTMDDLKKLKPAFDPNGTVTAGNASQLTDGSAMALLTSEAEAAKRGWPVRARVLAHTTFGVEPKELFMAPVGAIKQAVDKAGLRLADIDLFEINEAFAAQMVACVRGLELNYDRVNVLGGAIALGHPIGASGTRVLVTLINAMEHRNLKRGVASLCLGGGNAVAMVIERP